VRKITLRADEDLIERARLRAALEKKTLNAAFREWLQGSAWDTFAAQCAFPATR
jgi:predicted HicB family RNase H-like nuclease